MLLEQHTIPSIRPWSHLRIHMADFVCQCEPLSDLPSHAWERNMDVVELFSGNAELTSAFSFLLMNFQIYIYIEHQMTNEQIYIYQST